MQFTKKIVSVDLTYIVLTGCVGARRVVVLLARVVFVTFWFAFALVIIPLVLGVFAALSYIIHQDAVYVSLLHCVTKQNYYMIADRLNTWRTRYFQTVRFSHQQVTHPYINKTFHDTNVQ